MNKARNLKCPATDCNFVWCRECQQEIVPDGPEHSCDDLGSGFLEMNHQGWTHCPCKYIPPVCSVSEGNRFIQLVPYQWESFFRMVISSSVSRGFMGATPRFF